MMLLKEAVQHLDIEQRKELIELISRCREIDGILTYEPDCDRMALLRERRLLRRKAAALLAQLEQLRQKLEQEACNDRESISPKRERKSLGLFRNRKKKVMDSGA